MEEAQAYNLLIKKYNLTQQQLSEKLGKERVTIANTLRLLQLAPKVRMMLVNSEISMGQAKVLLSVKEEDLQTRLAKIVRDKKLTVRATEKLVAKELEEGLEISEINGENLTDKLIKNLIHELQAMAAQK